MLRLVLIDLIKVLAGAIGLEFLCWIRITDPLHAISHEVRGRVRGLQAGQAVGRETITLTAVLRPRQNDIRATPPDQRGENLLFATMSSADHSKQRQY
jgi:hypothetical protein